MEWLAAGCVVAAAALVVPVRPRTDSGPTSLRWSPRPGLLVVAIAAALLAAGSGRTAVLLLVVCGVALGGARLVRARRRERVVRSARVRVVELCDALQAELMAGQTAGTALDRVAAEWPAVGPVARAAAAGGDVPAALRRVAAQPGSGALRIVAAAWQVAHRTGHGLADALGRVADDLRAAEQTRRVVVGELASARATARLLALLPLFALAVGAGAGADPWSFLLGHPAGVACLIGGLTFAFAGLAWIDALAGGIDEEAP